MGYVLPAKTFSPIVWRDVPDYVLGRKNFVLSETSYAVHLYNEMCAATDSIRRVPIRKAR